MSSDIPEDLRGHFKALEQQAVFLMRSGNYELAEKIFQAMLDTIFERQEVENRRVHKGSFFHNIGISRVLQKRLMDAMRSFLLAYVEDCINEEESADKAPAARILMTGFFLRKQNMLWIKDAVRVRRQRGEDLLNPENVLGGFLSHIGVSENDLFTLCSRLPELELVRNKLVVNLTPKAKQALDKTVSETTNRVLQKALSISKKRGGQRVTENDIQEAIRQLREE